VTALEKTNPDKPAVTDLQAAEAMKSLGIESDPAAMQAYKTLGTWLVANDVGACQLAKTFDSETQIQYAIEISRELCGNEDPYVRSNGVKSLLLAVKTRSALAEQAIRLANSSGGNSTRGHRNLPPVFNGPVTVVSEKPPIPV